MQLLSGVSGCHWNLQCVTNVERVFVVFLDEIRVQLVTFLAARHFVLWGMQENGWCRTNLEYLPVLETKD